MLSRNGYDPVRHLSNALFPFDQKERVMVMLMDHTIYYDESENTRTSANPGQLRVYTIAGCVGFDRQWIKLQKKWKAILEKEVQPYWLAVGKPLPVYFHMTDFANPHDKVYGRWPEDKKKKLLGSLHKVMADHILRRFATGILVNDYDELEDEEKFIIGHPHVAATINCLKRIREWANSENRKDRMLHVFEKGSAHDTKIRRLFDAVLSEEMKEEYRVSGLAFEDKRDFPALQASDILATETRWEVCRQFDPNITRKQRGSIRNLYMPNIDDWLFIGKKELRAILENPVVKKFRERGDHMPHVATAKRKGWI